MGAHGLLELFSGTGSVGRAFARRGWEVVSLDRDPTPICADILQWDYRAYAPDHFRVVWASPDCTQHSRARTTARTPRDLEGADALVLKALEIIRYFSDCTWFIENPQTGLLKTRACVQNRLAEQGAKLENLNWSEERDFAQMRISKVWRGHLARQEYRERRAARGPPADAADREEPQSPAEGAGAGAESLNALEEMRVSGLLPLPLPTPTPACIAVGEVRAERGQTGPYGATRAAPFGNLTPIPPPPPFGTSPGPSLDPPRPDHGTGQPPWVQVPTAKGVLTSSTLPLACRNRIGTKGGRTRWVSTGPVCARRPRG